MSWSTTPEGAARVISALRPPTPAEEARAAREIWPDTPVVMFPSPFALRLWASLTPGATSVPAPGVYRPASLAAALALLGVPPPPEAAATWRQQQYPHTPPPLPSGADGGWPTGLYSRAYLAVARDGGYQPPHPLPPLTRLSAAAVLVVPAADGAVVGVARHPRRITRDALVAIAEFADRTRTMSAGGAVVPARFSRPWRLSAKEIAAVESAELRAWLIERCAGPRASAGEGWARFLRASRARVIDQRANDIEGTREALFAARDHNVLVASCPTGRMFALPVPSECTTCAAAQAWLHQGARIVART